MSDRSTSESADATLHSYDVFDTVLTRLVGRPASLFVLLGHHAAKAGLWTGSPELFANVRVAAEERARVHAKGREVTLKGIYEEVAFAYECDANATARIASMEVSLEGDLVRAVPSARDVIAAARKAGHKVAFISDIYLPREAVSGWLEREGLTELGDDVWVSSESGATKASGALFREVQEGSLVPVNRWRHFGDHPWSDVAVPRARGIAAEQWKYCSLSRYEEQMESHTSSTSGLSSLLAGASRWVRLTNCGRDKDQTVLAGIAAGVAGPVLWAFVTWVLRQAKRQGLRSVWFTARDGQVMLRMARHIAARLNMNVELGYLYGGRQVVHLAGLHAIDERALKWLVGGAGVITADSLLERVGLSAASVEEALRRHGIPQAGVIGWSRAGRLEAFFRDPIVEAAVLAKAAERRADMRSYFGACGLMGSDPCAIVDIGWRGSVLRSMFDILGPKAATQHHFLYFGLFGRPQDAPEARMSAFMFDEGRSPALGTGQDIPSLMAVMEIFCQADHGQVVHVTWDGSRHVPLLRPPAPAGPTHWDVVHFQNCLEAYAKAMRADLVVDPDADLRKMCEQLLRMLVAQPAEGEARVLGSVQYVDDQSGSTSQPFAQAFEVSDFRDLIRRGELPQKALAWWQEGAWTLTSKPVRLWLSAARKIGSARRRWKLRSRNEFESRS